MGTVVRGATAFLAVVYLWWGAWARIAPRQFFDQFPGFGRRWTAAYPPYNEHLVSDLGATFLTLAFLLAVGAVVADRRIRWLVLGAVLLFNLLHLGFHAADRGLLAPFDFGASLAALVAGVLIPIALLLVEIIGPARRTTAGAGDRDDRQGGD